MSESKKTTKSESAATGEAKKGAKSEGGMTDADSKFLIECLKHTKGNITIDLDGVATALEYNNPKSVGNRLTILKKKYGLTLTTSAANSKNSGNADGGEVASSPIKPDKVKKPRTPKKAGDAPAPRKKAATPKKGKKSKETVSSEEEDVVKAKDIKDEDVNVEEELSDEREDMEVDEADLIHKQNEEAGTGTLFPKLGAEAIETEA